jgi:hypothetical protein
MGRWLTLEVSERTVKNNMRLQTEKSYKCAENQDRNSPELKHRHEIGI